MLKSVMLIAHLYRAVGFWTQICFFHYVS